MARCACAACPSMKRSLGEIAHALGGVAGFSLPAGVTPGLAATHDFVPPAITYTNGTHVVECEVDPETGFVRLTRYVVVHDCGRMINPMMVEGQVHGGVAHGIGCTLYEWMRYDDAGQPQTVTFADYMLPTSDTVPPIEIHHMESPTPLNPAWRQGRGRERDHRRAGGHCFGDRGRAPPLRRAHHRPARDARAPAIIDPRGTSKNVRRYS